jgi:predicted small metal-binding protein
VDRVLVCECGFVARGAGEAELVATVRRHASKAHGMVLSHEQAAQLVARAARVETPPATPPQTRTDEEDT